MTSGRRQAINSVFIKANASIDSMLEKDILNDVADYGRELMANEEPIAVIGTEPDNRAKDPASQVITHVHAFLSDKRDSQCLSPLLVHVVNNLKEMTTFLIYDNIKRCGYTITR